MPKKSDPYPRIKALGLEVHKDPIAHLKRKELHIALQEQGEIFMERFHDLFGIQTCYIEGPYPWDVEAVLERMASGKLTASQKDWD